MFSSLEVNTPVLKAGKKLQSNLFLLDDDYSDDGEDLYDIPNEDYDYDYSYAEDSDSYDDLGRNFVKGRQIRYDYDEDEDY